MKPQITHDEQQPPLAKLAASKELRHEAADHHPAKPGTIMTAL